MRLTFYERRVLELAADGLTNWQIAERLDRCEVSPGEHLTDIYRKLGIRHLKSGEKRKQAIWMYFTGEAFSEERPTRAAQRG